MYNEGNELMLNTMQGCVKNLKAFRNAGVDPDKVACVIIADGIKPFMNTYEADEDL